MILIVNQVLSPSIAKKAPLAYAQSMASPNTAAVRPCCQTGCPDCPHGYTEKTGPETPRELRDPWEGEDDGESGEVYPGEVPPEEELPCRDGTDA